MRNILRGLREGGVSKFFVPIMKRGSVVGDEKNSSPLLRVQVRRPIKCHGPWVMGAWCVMSHGNDGVLSIVAHTNSTASTRRIFMQFGF